MTVRTLQRKRPVSTLPPCWVRSVARMFTTPHHFCAIHVRNSWTMNVLQVCLLLHLCFHLSFKSFSIHPKPRHVRGFLPRLRRLSQRMRTCTSAQAIALLWHVPRTFPFLFGKTAIIIFPFGAVSSVSFQFHMSLRSFLGRCREGGEEGFLYCSIFRTLAAAICPPSASVPSFVNLGSFHY